MGAPLWLVSPFPLLPLPPVCHRLPVPPRAVPWAPLHEGHGKPAPFHGQREWGHPERLHSSHKVCWKIPLRSLVILGALILKEVVRSLRLQTRRILESNFGENAAELLRIRSSHISCLQCLGERRIKKQRKWKEVNTLQWQHPKHWVASPVLSPWISSVFTEH